MRQAEYQPLSVRMKQDKSIFVQQYAEEVADLEARLATENAALKLFLDRMNRFGNWDDGCFYYSRVAAPELQEPIRTAAAAMKAGAK